MIQCLSELCAHVGVHTRYRGFDGQMIEVTPETQRAVLDAMGLDIASETHASDMLRQLQQDDAKRPLPPDVIVLAGQPHDLSLKYPADWELEAEGGGIIASGQTAGDVSLPALSIGIHRLRVSTGAGEFTSFILARPARAVQLEDRVPEPRIWGVLAALYGLTDGEAAPLGSFDLLGAYAAALAGHGADFIGINPVHAMGQVRPSDVISPYSPSHREFLNTWHCAGVSPFEGDAGELVDYPAALQANAKALSDQYEAFCDLPAQAPGHLAFEAFVADSGAGLHQFALFDALAGTFGADWRDWPACYRDHDAAALRAFETAHAGAIRHSTWAQWQADQQLATAQAKALDNGMRVGLFLDLAVGPRLGGAETWDQTTSLITKATLGAPPDPLGPSGQSWGLAPQSPLGCRADGYAGFSRLLRAVMRHAGMIRIDHVLGLMRSFWIPEGASEGAYVSYPFEALLAVVAIESARHNTIVVGEDLGLVPEGLREKLAETGIYGLDVLQYMRAETGGFVDPVETRRQAVCAFATHDTPTIKGFFGAEDTRIRHQIGDIDDEMLAQTRADRTRAQSALATQDPVTDIHSQLARANAGIVAVQLDDITARLSQQNLPGTIETYPNWRLKAEISVAEIASSPTLTRLGQEMQAHGRSNDAQTGVQAGARTKNRTET